MTGRFFKFAAAAALILLATSCTNVRAQGSAPVAELRDQLRSRYDIVTLQQGLALVPRSRTSNVRMIQIANGVVTVDGEALTGRQLADRLGRDAALVVQLSYLDRAGQQAVASPAAVAEPAPQAPAAETPADTTPRPQTRFGDVVRIANGGVTIMKDERVDGEVVVIVGDANIDGEVTRDVTVILGTLTLGPNAVVRGDVTTVAGHLDRATSATVHGKIDEVGIGGVSVAPGSWIPHGPVFGPNFRVLPRRPFGSAGGVAGTIARIVLLMLLSLIAVSVARPAVEHTGRLAAANPVKAGLVGLLAELLFLPVVIAIVIVLAISIVGIPLLILVPFGVGAVIVLMLVGFIGVAFQVGSRLTGRRDTNGGVYLACVVGVLALLGLTLIARLAFAAAGGFLGLPLIGLGYFVEYLAWTIGAGALILAWSERRRARSAAAAAPQTAPAQG